MPPPDFANRGVVNSVCYSSQKLHVTKEVTQCNLSFTSIWLTSHSYALYSFLRLIMVSTQNDHWNQKHLFKNTVPTIIVTVVLRNVLHKWWFYIMLLKLMKSAYFSLNLWIHIRQTPAGQAQFLPFGLAPYIKFSTLPWHFLMSLPSFFALHLVTSFFPL